MATPPGTAWLSCLRACAVSEEAVSEDDVSELAVSEVALLAQLA